MTDIKITIEAPDLSAAISRLAAAVGAPAVEPAVPVAVQTAPGPVQTPAQTASPGPVPVASAPLEARVSAVPPAGQTAAPGNPAPGPAVPVASAPAYTLDQISRAGAALVDAGKMEPLLALLTRYGVQAVTQLPPDQYGAFATELRSLGAQI